MDYLREFSQITRPRVRQLLRTGTTLCVLHSACLPRPVTVLARLRTIPSWQVTLGAALLGLGFLIAAQLSSEGPRVRYTTQERSPLVETATQLQDRQEALKTRILDLRAQIQAAEQKGQGSAALVRELNDGLQEARIAAGLIPLTGSGIVLSICSLIGPQRPKPRGFAPILASRGSVEIVPGSMLVERAKAHQMPNR